MFFFNWVVIVYENLLFFTELLEQINTLNSVMLLSIILLIDLVMILYASTLLLRC